MTPELIAFHWVYGTPGCCEYFPTARDRGGGAPGEERKNAGADEKKKKKTATTR